MHIYTRIIFSVIPSENCSLKCNLKKRRFLENFLVSLSGMILCREREREKERERVREREKYCECVYVVLERLISLP